MEIPGRTDHQRDHLVPGLGIGHAEQILFQRLRQLIVLSSGLHDSIFFSAFHVDVQAVKPQSIRPGLRPVDIVE
ncbi:MAG: hypothetical protein BWY82_02876 [Verrucomicrobia bacterium ADurb.Bin474]|nr:MAG: hypothetical protein BWY82_02876 [Verrucomicrobia bacterium ADurb.Bin474]